MEGNVCVDGSFADVSGVDMGKEIYEGADLFVALTEVYEVLWDLLGVMELSVVSGNRRISMSSCWHLLGRF